MRFSLALATLGIAMSIGASPCAAQMRVRSIEELRRTLAAGDVITVVPADGQPVAGRLIRVGPGDLEVRVAGNRTPQDRGRRDVTIPLEGIRSLERPRDSARNGAWIGAGVGAGIGATMFAYAYAVDRNELDEWAPYYLGSAAAYIGVGALIGWAIDSANSKPHIKFESPGGNARITLQPVYTRSGGLGLTVSYSR